MTVTIGAAAFEQHKRRNAFGILLSRNSVVEVTESVAVTPPPIKFKPQKTKVSEIAVNILKKFLIYKRIIY